MAYAPWFVVARALLGTTETAGPANNPRIMGWADKLGVKVLGIVYPNDATPWCGLFAAHCVNAVGLKPAHIAIRAKSWATWGVAVTPCVGAVLVFDREGGGHVGFYAGETSTHFLVLGGNQKDKVCEILLAKDRLVKDGSRWPAGVPVTGKPNKITASGAAVSTNEA